MSNLYESMMKTSDSVVLNKVVASCDPFAIASDYMSTGTPHKRDNHGSGCRTCSKINNFINVIHQKSRENSPIKFEDNYGPYIGENIRMITEDMNPSY